MVSIEYQVVKRSADLICAGDGRSRRSGRSGREEEGWEVGMGNWG